MIPDNIGIKVDATDFVNATATTVGERVVETIVDLWDLTFGGVELYAQKIRLKRDKELEEFKKELLSDINDIPQDNLIEPRFSIIGPVMEASKYYFEEPELRSMFSKLIAASVNSTLSNKARNSFSQIIQQLEPVDASNLSLFKNTHSLPIVNIVFKVANQKTATRNFKMNVFISNPSYKDFDCQSTSLVNLSRLGLIEIFYDKHFTDERTYNNFESTVPYKLAELTVEKDPNLEKVSLQKGIVRLTSFGKDFIQVTV